MTKLTTRKSTSTKLTDMQLSVLSRAVQKRTCRDVREGPKRRHIGDPRMPGCFVLRSLRDGWTVVWRTIDALLVKYQSRRTAVIFVVEPHGKI